jgi:proteasome lid subunit RPN8/RPN11
MLYVVDDVVAQITEKVARFEPERGGALLGLPGKPVVLRFLFDREAEATSSTYRPSRALAGEVRALEVQDNLEFKGILHSHPSGLDRPSMQDERELATGLSLNPQLSTYLSPIVTLPWGSRRGELAGHELPAGDGKISFFAAHRRRSGQVQVAPEAVSEVPLARDLELVRETFGGDQRPEVFASHVGGRELLAGRVVLPGELELLVLASELYPALPPILLLTPAGRLTEQVQPRWSLTTAETERLVEALRSLIVPPGPFRRAFGPSGVPPLTADPDRARLAGWDQRWSGTPPQQQAAELRDALFARSSGLLSRDLAGSRVLVAGCGSVGSYIAEQLVRSGIGAVTLIDPEPVEADNVCRSAYDLSDIGRLKVDALGRRLLHINPMLGLDLRPMPIAELKPTDLEALVQSADLTVGATDDPAAQLTLNRFAYARGRPAVFVGLYAGAQGGEVVLSVPGSPCYGCATSVRHESKEAAALSAELDYGTGRLRGEPAISADIQHVSSSAVKLVLSLVLPDDAQAGLRAFAAPMLADSCTYLTLSMSPSFWFYDEVFGETPGQYAYQAVWITTRSRPDCPTCGDPELRVDPLDLPLSHPRPSEPHAS